MQSEASELARRLARDAEAVCRYYLSNGRRAGRYWQVGDARNTPGRSMFVRLHDSAKGPAGKWMDAATGEHGDLLDVIRESRSLFDFREVVGEARRFLNIVRVWPPETTVRPPVPAGSVGSARRLAAMALPIVGTLVETYLRNRALTALHETDALRFYPRVYYRAREDAPTEIWPAMIAVVTNLDGRLTGVHRTWLDPIGFDPIRLGKAPIATPRRALGDLLGNAVRFGMASYVLAAGEGIETMLSLRVVMPGMPAAAALSAAHLAAILLPAAMRRLYIVRDSDPAGDSAEAALTDRAQALGIETIPLSPILGDFNEDLRKLGARPLAESLRRQLVAEDAERFLALSI
jgi:hypothetical protein